MKRRGFIEDRSIGVGLIEDFEGTSVMLEKTVLLSVLLLSTTCFLFAEEWKISETAPAISSKVKNKELTWMIPLSMGQLKIDSRGRLLLGENDKGALTLGESRDARIVKIEYAIAGNKLLVGTRIGTSDEVYDFLYELDFATWKSSPLGALLLSQEVDLSTQRTQLYILMDMRSKNTPLIVEKKLGSQMI